MGWSLFSLSCSGPGSIIASEQSAFLEWFIYLLFASCSQRFLVSLTHLLFFFISSFKACIHLCTTKEEDLHSQPKPRSRPVPHVGALYPTTLALTIAVSLAAIGVALWHILYARSRLSNPVLELVFVVAQALAWVTFVLIVSYERRSYAAQHPPILRIWFLFAFCLSLLQCTSAIIRLTESGFSYDVNLRVDDVFTIATFPVSIFLLVVSATGSTGIGGEIAKRLEGSTREPLLISTPVDPAADPVPVTKYATAGLLSRSLFLWLNPLLEKGAKASLQVDDVPRLSPQERSDDMYALFMSFWPKGNNDHPVRTTLLKCFAGQLAITAVLALVKTLASFVGPLLLQSFSDYIEGDRTYFYEGYFLVVILAVAQIVTVVSTHQFNFLSKKLGNLIHSALVPTLYRKSLRLSSAARELHGAGQIVNYMSVDLQQIAEATSQLHNIWVLPFQVVLSVSILYFRIGLSMLAGVGVLLLCSGSVYVLSRFSGGFLYSMMISKDARMKGTTEVLNNMKIIKLQAWDEFFQRRIEDLRLEEYRWLSKFTYVFACNTFVLVASTTLASLATFGTCVLLGQELSSGIIFTVISLFNNMQEAIRSFPQAIVSISQAVVSIHRLDRYMLSKELEFYVTRLPAQGQKSALTIENGCFTWDEEEKTPTLRDINLDVSPGSLVAVVGTVGSGKSSLLAALLGEMSRLSGRVRVCGTTAYVPQTSWIQNATIEENILFGLPMDRSKYRQTLHACALEQDLSQFQHGDQTEIGERGINLSGGQKQRLQLARAVYQDSDIYFLDDVFSAVDAQTGSHLFKECILGPLNRKTRVLVTHQMEFLNEADLILVMSDGVIIESGSYTDLLKSKAELSRFVSAHEEAIGKVEKANETMPMGGGEISENRAQILKHTSSGTFSDSKSKHAKSRSFSISSLEKDSSKLIEEEQRETGMVKWEVYWMYFTRAYRFQFILLLFLVQVVMQAFSVGSDFWLAYESSSSGSFNAKIFICVYFLLCLGVWAFTVIKNILLCILGLKTSQKFFLDMLHSIFRAPMSFFDTTPTGRILTRSSTDQASIDIWLPLVFQIVIALYSATFGILVVMCYTTWPVIFAILPLMVLYVWYQRFYLASSRELSRLDSITKAPIIDHFTETVAGFLVIRGFQKQGSFSLVNTTRTNNNLKMYFHFIAATEWIGLRLEFIGTTLLCCSALLLVALPQGLMNSELAALSLSYGLTLNTMLSGSVFFSCELENRMVAPERILQFTMIPSERPQAIEGCSPSTNWPQDGHIVIRDLKARYQPNKPLILKGISADIEGGKKIGVVGRTGSGKSTLIQVIFRIIEPAGGQILIDEVDITSLGLKDLRSRLGIIPQDPVLFEGTIRTNLDPLGVHTDDEIWEGLRKCQLATVVEDKLEKLGATVGDNGENWSVGQRQLLCLGRALLKRSRILFLDEATASMDTQTDATLQKVIAKEFGNSTVVSIAHRISTVMDSHKVMVLDAGYLKEFDSPAKLLEQTTTLFSALVREYTAHSKD